MATQILIKQAFSLSTIRQLNLIETNDFEDILNDLTNSTNSELGREIQNDEVIQEVFFWKNLGSPDQYPNLPMALRKYRKALFQAL